MSKITTSLGLIFSWFQARSLPLSELLQSGLQAILIDTLIKDLPFSFPEELAELYSWCNGTTLSQEYNLNAHYFLPGYYLLSLQDALHYYLTYSTSDSWDHSWFPIMASGSGDFYVINCGGKGQKNNSVLNFIRGEYNTPLVYLNIHAMLLTIAECYEVGAYFIDELGFLKVDYELEAAISLKHNPSVEEWENL